jgi:hypothetical protein
MGDSSLRFESFSNKTEPKKMEAFIKCYELLNKYCYKIFNDSFLAEYNENFKSDYPNYKSFLMDRLGYIYYVIK